MFYYIILVLTYITFYQNSVVIAFQWIQVCIVPLSFNLKNFLQYFFEGGSNNEFAVFVYLGISLFHNCVGCGFLGWLRFFFFFFLVCLFFQYFKYIISLPFNWHFFLMRSLLLTLLCFLCTLWIIFPWLLLKISVFQQFSCKLWGMDFLELILLEG